MVEKRRGRPALAPTLRKNVNLTFRARGNMREQLSVEAKANGRSISEEIERRLEKSLQSIERRGPRPVLAFRVHEDIYASLHSSAVERGVSISEEAAQRIRLSFERQITLSSFDDAIEACARGILRRIKSEIEKDPSIIRRHRQTKKVPRPRD